jgi:hypothetical protein
VARRNHQDGEQRTEEHEHEPAAHEREQGHHESTDADGPPERGHPPHERELRPVEPGDGVTARAAERSILALSCAL